MRKRPDPLRELIAAAQALLRELEQVADGAPDFLTAERRRLQKAVDTYIANLPKA